MTRLFLAFTFAAAPAFADSNGFSHMMDPGYGYGYGVGMMFGPVLWIIVLGLVVAGVIWAFRRLEAEPPHKRASSALAELDLRFARGEIDPDDYAARKKLLSA